MKLSIKDRLVINAFYPQKANLIDQILVKDIKKKVDFSQDELEKYKIASKPNGGLSWSSKDEFDIEFTKKEKDLLKKQLDILDKQNQITQDLVDLCLKIKGK